LACWAVNSADKFWLRLTESPFTNTLYVWKKESFPETHLARHILITSIPSPQEIAPAARPFKETNPHSPKTSLQQEKKIEKETDSRSFDLHHSPCDFSFD
jgi:hypothetical protein